MFDLVLSEWFGIVFSIGFVVLGIGNIYFLTKSKSVKTKRKHFIAIFINIILSYVGYYIFKINNNYKTEAFYVEGLIIDYCKTGKNGRYQGVLFRYSLNGRYYYNCNRDRLKIGKIGNKYQVQVTSDHPDLARIDLNQPINH